MLLHSLRLKAVILDFQLEQFSLQSNFQLEVYQITHLKTSEDAKFIKSQIDLNYGTKGKNLI